VFNSALRVPTLSELLHASLTMFLVRRDLSVSMKLSFGFISHLVKPWFGFRKHDSLLFLKSSWHSVVSSSAGSAETEFKVMGFGYVEKSYLNSSLLTADWPLLPVPAKY